MAKSTIRIEEAHAVINRVAEELGLLVADAGFGKKIQGPANKHRLYVQKGQFLGRIDFTVPLEPNDPAYIQLAAPNGSVRCHVTPDLEQLERCLRMLGDDSLGTQVPNKPRPFAPTKSSGRRPKAVEMAIPAEALAELPVDPARAKLEDRIRVIHEQARAARIRMVLENPEKYGDLSGSEAEALVDGKFEGSDPDAVSTAETDAIIRETGIEVSL